MSSKQKLLVLTIGYGQGHCAAAAALEEEFKDRGWNVRVIDPCESDKSGVYSLTKWYYRLCVRRAPWLWGITYGQTDTSDWSSKVDWPGIRSVVRCLQDELISWKPDYVLCTYPLYGYMLDAIAGKGVYRVPYAMVVTDSIEISKPWLHTQAETIYVPDEYSRELINTRYKLKTERLIASGFPVRKAFLVPSVVAPPDEGHLRIVYGTYLGARESERQIKSMLRRYPYAHIHVLAGERFEYLSKCFSRLQYEGSVDVVKSSAHMSDLFSHAHVYIGKTGAATMFESYAKSVPFIANFALPGQEQGNLELLIQDGVGAWAGSTEQLGVLLDALLQDGARRWHLMKHNMQVLRKRVSGAEVIANDVIKLACQDER